jgi:predicted dehydrogenase
MRGREDYRKLAGMVDAVSIAVPTGAHHEVASVFLNAGVDVLLEKPIAVTLAEADALIALADRAGLIFQIGFVERFNPAVAALHSVMGRPLFIESHRLHPFFERGTDVDVILDLMVHDLDIILHFVRSPVETVDAVGVSVLSEKVDIANARLTFASGCVANITASRVTAKTMQKIRFGVEGYHAVDYQKRKLVPWGETAPMGGDDHGESRGDQAAGPRGRDPCLRPSRHRSDSAPACPAGDG